MRRPRDFVTTALGALLALWAMANVDRPPRWERAFVEFVQSSPDWVETLLSLGYLLSLVYALVVLGALVFGGPERREALRDLVIVTLGSLTLVVLVSLLINGAWPYVIPEIDLQDPVPRFPVTRVAMVTAMLVVVDPYLTRPLRRFGWVAITATAVAAVGLDYGTPLHTLGSFGLGLFGAGLLLVVTGSPRGYPNPETVAAGLTRLGVPNPGVTLSDYQTWGAVRFETVGEDGGEVEVKAYGRDAFDSQLAAKVWRTLMYREIGRTVSFTRLQAVQHEALATLMAQRAGVTVPDLLAVGSASPDVALVAVAGSGPRLSDVDPGSVEPERLSDIWRNVAILHDASISHGALRSESIHLTEEGPVISGFALASLAPEEDDIAADVVELLFSTAARFGADRAVQAALAGYGEERLVDALPYLQLPAISSTARRQTDGPKRLIAALTAEITERTGAEQPEPVQLRRVTLRNLVMTVLLLLLATAMIPALTAVDYAEIWGILEDSNWVLVAAAFLVGHSQFVPQATATMFAVPARLPFWPLLVLQTASQFISLAIPSAAGRVAMNAAFLHKFGVSIATAVTQGAIDSFSGFLVQAAILVFVLATGDIDLGLDIDKADVPWLLILGGLALVIAGAVVTVMRVRRLRDRIVPVVRQAWDALRVVLRQPVRAIGLLGSNFVYWNVLGMTLWLALQAVGSDLSYGTALFVAAGTSLFAGFMPVPGGVGVAEATMTALLVTFGADEAIAFAVTMVYRIITFYLPALEGLFGTRWLERNDYV